MATPSPSKHDRPSLPTSSRAFALPGGGVPPPLNLDGLQASPFLMLRGGARPSALAHRSPLAVSFAARGGGDDGMALDCESPTPPESGDATPPPMFAPLGPPVDVCADGSAPLVVAARRGPALAEPVRVQGRARLSAAAIAPALPHGRSHAPPGPTAAGC
jgi:hypothetical protein